MADLFDIANLITTVGVDGVKIKPEPGLPEKSSNEILTELFSTFDVEGTVSPEPSDQQVPVANVKLEKDDSLQAKKKKSKKKHKHKDKKHKKKSKHNSSDSNSDVDSNGIKKKKKHKKKSKRKHESHSSKSSDSDDPKAKVQRLSNDVSDVLEGKNNLTNDTSEKYEVCDDKELEDMSIKREPVSDDELRKNLKERKSKSPDLPPISKNIEGESEEPVTPKLIEKPKLPAQGKIQIKDLKNSIVYNETVKEVENKERAKAARMEDGELSDSSVDDNRTPTLSPTPPPHGLYEPPSLSPRRNSLTCKNDLRLVLREKEKKRLENFEKNKTHDKDHKDSKYKDHSHKGAKSSDNKRSRSCHSQDRKRSDSQSHSNLRRSRSRGRDKRRARSRDRHDRGRSSERHESARSRERRRHRSRSDDRNRDKYLRGRSRSRERKERIEIDKKKLLEIARRNAINMIKQGTLPLAQQDKAIAAIQAGGKTVDELTDFCKSLSKSEALGELSSISSDEDGSGSEKGFHHPFLLKERPSSIIMNIRDAKQLPTKTFQEKAAESSNQLRLQFPVSSGQHHRKSENEWVPVTPKKPEPKKAFVPATTLSEPLAIMPPPPVPVQAPSIQAPVQIPVPAPVQAPVQNPVPGPVAVPMPVQPSIQGPIQPTMQPGLPSTVFPQQPVAEPIDIGSIVSQRLAAMRKLRENPNDVCALNQMYRAQTEMKTWAESKQMPGQFTGSTGAKVLSPAELSSGYQAWARKDQLVSAQPVSGGMGMALLQKMGWRPGEGLGKNKEGALEPLQLEVKLDKRGLVSEQDIGQKVGRTMKPLVPTIKTLEGKHPVSLLGEYCSKKKIGAPVYELCFECGPDHKKNFLFKVRVNGVEYKPSVASPNKKQAKAEAAQICLQTLGLVPL